MPFVQRNVQPENLSRARLHDENGKPLVTDWELETVANNTLSNALRQLASLVLIANDIFVDLSKQLENVTTRSRALRSRIAQVDEKLSKFDPKTVTVPVGDMTSFASIQEHYKAKNQFETGLFSAETRPDAVKVLYAAAAITPVPTMRQLDRWRRDGHRSSRFFMCTPVLGAKRRKIQNRVDIDIETRLPAAIEDLRRWTSEEALGDVTAPPDCVSRIQSGNVSDGDVVDQGGAASGDEGIDHKLPSPEEQVIAIANKFPAEIVAVDVSGRRFDRMCAQRRSLINLGKSAEEVQETGDPTLRRKSRSRKPRAKRRNTIAGTDQKEIQEAICAGEPSEDQTEASDSPKTSSSVPRSKSSDLLRPSKRLSPTSIFDASKKSHFNTLKQWGRNRLKMINKSFESKTNSDSIPSKVEDLDDVNIYETVTTRRKKNIEKERTKIETKTNIPITNMAVKLRESAVQRRQRRHGTNKDEPHSSSGNWSASSESGRTSIGSEITTSTTQPKSTTSCATTSSNSLNLTTHNSITAPGSSISRRRYIPTSNSSSVTSEGTLTPDIIHDLQHDDDGESSVYSCDTEGYYTSFHMDSGLKTLKEEEISMPSTPLQTTNALSNSTLSTSMSAENEYELFGKGSTSTTASSAGTVCTTLMASESQRSLVIGPAIPERKSSLSKLDESKKSRLESENKAIVVAMIHKSQNKGDESPDSGHNTSSSPIESINSPNGQRSCSEFEFSESSDLEGVDRIERIRIKTTINSSRIPSMCVITPPHSDDESIKSIPKIRTKISPKSKQENIAKKLLETDLDADLFKEKNRVVVAPVIGTRKMQLINVNPTSGYATVETIDSPPQNKSTINSMFDKLKTNLSNLTKKELRLTPKELLDSGDYVTIADVRNNNKKLGAGIYYANDVVKSNLDTVLTGKIPEDIEYVSLNELPSKMDEDKTNDSLERKRRQGARVTLDANGKVVYSSDSLRRRKGAHTTFEPGPFVKDSSTPTSSPLMSHRQTKQIRPVTTTNVSEANRPLSPQLGKIVIRANKSTDFVRMPPTKIVTPVTSPTPTHVKQVSGPVAASRGAYVNVQERAMAQEVSNPRGVLPEDEGLVHSMYNYQMSNVDVLRRSPYVDQLMLQEHHRQQFPISAYQHQVRNSPIYRTLPTRRKPQILYQTQNDEDCHVYQSPRSVTPDITRGLYNRDLVQSPTSPTPAYGPNSPVHCEFMKRANPSEINLPNMYGTDSPVRSNKFTSSTPTKASQLLKSKIPMGISNFFSPISSKIQSTNKQPNSGTDQVDSPKISPIDPRNSNDFKASTPTNRVAVNLASSLIPPKKSTMSHEELYAVIHKSKKKFNIGTISDEGSSGRASPALSTTSSNSVESNLPRDRHSWSPSQKDPLPNSLKGIGSRQSWAERRTFAPKTSTMDFKRLLLQQHSKSNPLANKSHKMSAVEQLKLTKPTGNSSMNILDLSSSPRNLTNRKFVGQLGSPVRNKPEPRITPKLVLSPRSAWRFSSPRSDVLSSTILEDCREDENSSLEKEVAATAAPERAVCPDQMANVIDDSNQNNQNVLNIDSRPTKPSTLSRIQFLQAQKAQFFLGGEGAKATCENRGEITRKCPSPPALETAL